MNAISESNRSTWRFPERCSSLCVRPDTACWALLLLLVNWPWFGSNPASALAFLPGAVAEGEWWRVLSHPLVHLSWYHLLLDAGAFLSLYEGLPDRRAWRRLGYVVATGAGSLGAAWLVSPHINETGLCGLSGIAHGLMAVMGLQLLSDPSLPASLRRVGWFAFLVVVGKAVWEAATGHASFGLLHFGMMGQPVVVSHAGGILGGLLAFLPDCNWRLKFSRRRPQRCPVGWG